MHLVFLQNIFFAHTLKKVLAKSIEGSIFFLNKERIIY